jgi:hypothetical protein
MDAPLYVGQHQPDLLLSASRRELYGQSIYIAIDASWRNRRDRGLHIDDSDSQHTFYGNTCCGLV